jgi:hypothetical protein
MAELSVESIFGANAGVVWRFLNSNGPSNIDKIIKVTGLRKDLVFGALGWLGRENKINMERKGRAIIVSLKEYESHDEPIKVTTSQDAIQQTQQKRPRFKAPKNAKKATSKVPKVMDKIGQDEKLNEFLLH